VKTNILKILAIATLMIFICTGVSMANGWRDNGGNRGHAYGHYNQRGYQHYQFCAPRPAFVERQYYPVVVARHVYYPPVVYRAPASSGYLFGMSVMEP
jgi:hypothetical protein